jgi:hypothetical protein
VSCNTTADASRRSDALRGRGKFIKTIPLDPRKNVTIMSTTPGIRKYSSFAADVSGLKLDVCCFVATRAPQPSVAEVTDDKEGSDLDESSESSSTQDSVQKSSPDKSDTTESDLDNTKRVVDFESHSEVAGLSIEEDCPLPDNQDELYRLHGVRTGHLSYAKLKAVARRGDRPSRLQYCKAPMCAACQYGKATKKPWRTKRKNRQIKVATKAGECVSVDQVESQAVGFVAQLKGPLTGRQYQVVTVFVDHHS